VFLMKTENVHIYSKYSCPMVHLVQEFNQPALILYNMLTVSRTSQQWHRECSGAHGVVCGAPSGA
jgi:hypothetical protein